MELTVIANLSSGGGRTRHLERALNTLRSAGASVELHVTDRPGHATELARQAGDRPVVAAGGDGTVNEVVNGLSPGATLGVLPLGTVNVLARELGLPLSPEAAARRLLEGSRTRIDLGVARAGSGAERRFVCMAGLGFDARVVESVTPELKERLRGLAFPLTAFDVHFRHATPQLQVIVGDEEYRVRFAIVANSHFYGGNYRIVEEPSLRSGALHVVLVEEVGTLLRPDVLPRILIHRPLAGYLPSLTTTALEATACEERVPVQLDGEPWGELPMSFRVEPAALEVIS
jgi:diacylglycerol kinase (ATP)